MNFSRFQKPSRYFNSEFNSIHKNGSAADSVRFCLAFPDVYEVGMSHLGMRILYDIANSLPFTLCERVFSPWTDLEDHLRKTGELLRTLESGTQLRDLDMIGFSLQYELSYTTVLNMIHLGGMPVSSAERINSSAEYPIVIAGGPCASNPAPMSDFIDAFMIGDAEEAIVEILDVMRQSKASSASTEETLRQLAKIKGMYVPHIHGRDATIQRRFIESLEDSPYPVCPVVPFAPIVHDRVTIEISRGCSMGCRFCQAGIIYRPVRERSPQRIIEIAKESLKNTGYDEVSLSSLSAGDYSSMLPLIQDMNRQFRKYKTAISLPSLRVGSIDRRILKEIKTTRKTGFTIAPEAATQRLRSVINKDFTDEQYEEALKMLFEEGWINLKLYYMIGLPTETEADIEAIGSMAMQALKTAKKNTGRFVNISITVSPFVPKPHTPFQWYGQISLDEMRRKLRYLRETLSSKKFKYKGHNEEMSFLEAVFSRGDHNLSPLIKAAWEEGCRLDGWTEHFDYGKWQTAMERTGIDGSSYSEKRYQPDSILPWDIVDTGVKKEFLLREYGKAVDEDMTIDCRKRCTACGLKCSSSEQTKQYEAGQIADAPAEESGSDSGRLIIRSRFSKTGRLKYLSHLELITAMQRALRRAGVPVEYSKGFHPGPRISFGPPLNVGVAGLREFFDMEVSAPFDIEFYKERINSTLPEGLRIDAMKEISREPSLTSFVNRYRFIVPIEDISTAVADEIKNGFCAADQNERFTAERDGRKVDLSGCVESIDIIREAEGMMVQLMLVDTENVKVRIGEIIRALFSADPAEINITRAAMYGRKDGWAEPL
ncbi:MAG: TIGR03960 family B12-binding radical SAM protein [Nitrospiraceae bacterium]|nr:TIGR03960 family B12-binding radical SAM protein [Nitrospiraceae bacterium]